MTTIAVIHAAFNRLEFTLLRKLWVKRLKLWNKLKRVRIYKWRRCMYWIVDITTSFKKRICLILSKSDVILFTVKFDSSSTPIFWPELFLIGIQSHYLPINGQCYCFLNLLKNWQFLTQKNYRFTNMVLLTPNCI